MDKVQRAFRNIRAGTDTAEDRAIADEFEAQEAARRANQEAKTIRGWWDLPVAEACWRADARVVEGSSNP